MKKYPRLILLFTSILVFMCRCNFPDDNRAIVYSDGSYANCRGYKDYDAKDGNLVTTSGYACPLACPDGSTVSFDMLGGPAFGQKYPKEELQAKYCAAGSAAAPSATATQTETPIVAAPLPPAAAPLLTGQVTTCDLESRYINFRFVDGAPEVSGDAIVLTMNGTQLNCTVPPSNKTILSCSLPPGITFPTDVKVAIGDSVTNQFSYNGDECFYVEPTGTPKPDATESGPAATPTPTL